MARKRKRGPRASYATGTGEAERQITSAVDAAFPPFPVRTLADMSEAEIAALERQYGALVKR